MCEASEVGRRNAERGTVGKGRLHTDAFAAVPRSDFRVPHFGVPRPVVQHNQLFKRLDPSLPRSPDQRPQDVSGGKGIPKGAMACRVLDAEECRHMVESAVTKSEEHTSELQSLITI